MVNAQDTSLNVQAAIKNLATNAVFYFVIPVDLDALFQSGASLDVNSYASTWKSMDESTEVSIVIKGERRH